MTDWNKLRGWLVGEKYESTVCKVTGCANEGFVCDIHANMNDSQYIKALEARCVNLQIEIAELTAVASIHSILDRDTL